MALDEPPTHLQHKNAGNLGDLLKHFCLIEVIRRVLVSQHPSKIAYMESHAGIGRYSLTPSRVRAIAKDKREVCTEGARWADFEEFNPEINKLIYDGSFVIALRQICKWKELNPESMIKATLWEKDDNVRTQIKDRTVKLLPSNLDNLCLKTECSPHEFISTAISYAKDGWTVVWLCDPYWGRFKKFDRQWFELLKHKCGYGVLFTFLGGNSRRKGTGKFDFVKSLGATHQPEKRIDQGIRSYGLYFTEEVRKLLAMTPGEYAISKSEGEKLGIILFAHGSVVEEANQGVHDLASEIRSLGRFHFVRAAFLDCAKPNLGEAITDAVQAGSERIIVIPYFLTLGIHLRRDLPNLLAPEKERFPRVAIDVGQSLEGHPQMSSIILERIEQVLNED